MPETCCLWRPRREQLGRSQSRGATASRTGELSVSCRCCATTRARRACWSIVSTTSTRTSVGGAEISQLTEMTAIEVAWRLAAAEVFRARQTVRQQKCVVIAGQLGSPLIAAARVGTPGGIILNIGEETLGLNSGN